MPTLKKTSTGNDSSSLDKGKGKAGGYSGDFGQEVLERLSEIRSHKEGNANKKDALIDLWKLTVPMLDRTRLNATPKDTASEEDKMIYYYKLYKCLDKAEKDRFDRLTGKYCTGTEKFRAPFIESPRQQERVDWAMEFSMIAMSLGVGKDEIANEVYETVDLGLLNFSWQKGKDLAALLEQKARDAREALVKVLIEFDQKHRFEEGAFF